MDASAAFAPGNTGTAPALSPGSTPALDVAVHFAALLGIQALYAWTYTQSAYLRGAVGVPLACRLLVWTTPVLAYLAWQGRNPLRALRLWPDAARGLVWGIAFGVALLGANVAGHSLLAGALTLNLQLSAGRWVNGIAMVGLSEEVVFRGWYLDSLSGRFGFARGNILQALLFVLIHCPGWYLLGQFHLPGIAQLVITIWAFGLFTGWLLRRSRSLWTCMVFHSFNNLASFVVQ